MHGATPDRPASHSKTRPNTATATAATSVASDNHHDDDAWVAPPALVRAFTRFLSWRLRGAPEWPGFDATLARARADDSALLVPMRGVAVLAAALGEEIVLVLPYGRAFDGIAAIAGALGAATVRWVEGARPKLAAGRAGRLPAIAVAPGTGHAAWAAAALSALGRGAIPLVVRPAGRALTIQTGLPTPVFLPFDGARAVVGPPFGPPDSGVGRAGLAERIERIFDRPAPADPPQVATSRRMARPIPLRLYRVAMSLFGLLLARPYLFVRARRGKEDGARLPERFGRAGLARPEGRLVWVHAASVGEVVSILPLSDALVRRGLCDSALVTTGTVTSARIVGQRGAAGVIHQFVPLDVPAFARRFFDHWRPSAMILIESELWPNLMSEAARRDVPLAIVNARMSQRSFARWARWAATARALLATTRLVLGQTADNARRFAHLGAQNVGHAGNLKFDVPPPPVTAGDLEDVERMTALRPLWLAASTHAGEETAIADVHVAIRDRFPNLLTIIVPRHPERGAAIAAEVEARWLVTARRAAGDSIEAKTDVYVADTIGELGLFYRLADIAFVGGSLVGVGGHNPIEPALLDCAILHGPEVHNFRDVYDALDNAGGAVMVGDEAILARYLSELLLDDDRVTRMIEANRGEVARNSGSMERTIAALEPVLAS